MSKANLAGDKWILSPTKAYVDVDCCCDGCSSGLCIADQQACCCLEGVLTNYPKVIYTVSGYPDTRTVTYDHRTGFQCGPVPVPCNGASGSSAFANNSSYTWSGLSVVNGTYILEKTGGAGTSGGFNWPTASLGLATFRREIFLGASSVRYVQYQREIYLPWVSTTNLNIGDANWLYYPTFGPVINLTSNCPDAGQDFGRSDRISNGAAIGTVSITQSESIGDELAVDRYIDRQMTCGKVTTVRQLGSYVPGFSTELDAWDLEAEMTGSYASCNLVYTPTNRTFTTTAKPIL